MRLRQIGLLLAVMLVAGAMSANALPIFKFTSYNAVFSFSDGTSNPTNSGNPAAPVNLVWDGTNFWSASGGNTSADVTMAEYDKNGTVVGTFNPGLNFTSLMSANGSVYAAQLNSQDLSFDPNIYQMTSPGSFNTLTPFVTLDTAAASLAGFDPSNGQVKVTFNGTEFDVVTNDNGAQPETMFRWAADGSFMNSVVFNGFGQGDENNFPQSVALADLGAINGTTYWLTYDDTGILSAWDAFGNRVETTQLNGAGSAGDGVALISLSHISGLGQLSNAAPTDSDGYAFQELNGVWTAYNVGPDTPEPASLLLTGTGILFLARKLRRAKKA